jgi:phosphatidylglycerophosphate synthase
MQIPVRVLSTLISRQLSKTGITPNQVTVFRGILNIASLVLFALGDWKSLIFAFLIFQIFEILDHVDGDLARLKNMGSKEGLFLEAIIDRLESTVFGFLGLCVTIGIYRQTNDSKILWVFIAITMGYALRPPRLLLSSDLSGKQGKDSRHAQYGRYYSVMQAKTLVGKVKRFAHVIFIWQNQIILWGALLYYPITKYLHFNPLFWGMVCIALMVYLDGLRRIYIRYRKSSE